MTSRSFQLVSELGFTFKLNRHEEMMSTTCELPFESLALDGSNYDSWSSNFLHTLKDIGPIAESIIVASILPKD